MIVKALEIRDDGTCISMLALKPIPENEAQRAILRHGGYGSPEDYVILIGAHDCEATYDPFKQRGRTRFEAHRYIIAHWDDLKDGDVIDVQYLLGERSAPKEPEIQRLYSDTEWIQMNQRVSA